MNIFTLIAILIILFSFINFKKAFLLYLLFGLTLNTNINILNIPGLPILSLNIVLVIILYISYLIQEQKIDKEIFPFTLKIPFILIGISYFISLIFAIAGIENTLSSVIKTLLEDYLIIWMIWRIITSKKDIVFLLNGLFILFTFASIYGLYENFSHNNPISDYTISISGGGDKVIDFTYGEDSQRGYRIKSIFTHAIGAGLNFSLAFFLFSYIIIFYKKYFKHNTLFIIIVCLFLILNIIFTNSRSTIIFFIIGIIPLLLKLSKNLIIIIFTIILIIPFISYLIIPYFDNLISIFNSEAAEKVGGSNIEMRFNQLNAAITMFKESPIWGLGPKTHIFFPDKQLSSKLLGLESIWIWTIIERGIFGIITLLILYYYLVFKFCKKNIEAIFITISFILTSSITSTPGLVTYFYYLVIIIILKIDFLRNKELFLRKHYLSKLETANRKNNG